MANYANLLATIAANIYTNGNNEVTAAMVKAAVDAMVASLGAGYQFMDVAHPGDTPSGYTDLKCCWLATEPGTYTNFGGIEINFPGVYFITYDSAWGISGANTLDIIPDEYTQAAGIEVKRGNELSNGFIITSGDPTYPGTYLDAGGYIGYTSSGRYLTAYPVKMGQKIKILGDMGSGAFGACGFSKTLPAWGTTGIIVLSLCVDNLDIDYTAPEDGWIVVWHRNSAEYCVAYEILYESNDYTKQETDALFTQLLGQLNAERVRGAELENGAIIPGADASTPGTYLQSNGVISSTTAGRYLTAYPVSRGQRVIIYGDMGSSQALAACGFSTTAPSVGVSGIDVLELVDGLVNKSYTVPEDGWLLVYHRNNAEYCLAYEEKLVIASESDLSGKTIAVLGDSIMQYMGGPLITGNAITLRSYDDPSDPTIYQESDATIIGGIIYLTSSLNGGVPDENSVRLEIVNSKQEGIDTRGWDYLRAKLGAKRVVNCAQGGGRIPEMGIVTAYPSQTTGDGYAGKLESLPNQVRMLLRMANAGEIDAPDCVVIWMGVNGTTQYDGGVSFEDAMQTPWSTLSDDASGYAARSVFFGALRYAVEAIYRAFPYANICLVSPIQNNRGDERINSASPAYRGYTDLKNTADHIKEVAQRYACLYFEPLTEIGIANFSYKADTMDGTNEISTGERLGNLVPEFLADGLHPSSAGNIVLANYLAKRLNSSFFLKQ